MSGEILTEWHDDVAVVRIARVAKANALTKDMLVQLRNAFRESVASGAVGVILTGGLHLFSAGMDLGEVGNGLRDLDVDEEIRQTSEFLVGLPIPTLAAVEGRCIGAAVEIALACDIRVVGDSADFSIPAARLGILYRPDAIVSLVNVVGRATAMRLLVFGERINAVDALARGLATHAVADGTTLAVSLALCEGLPRNTQEAVSASRRLIAGLGIAGDDVSKWEHVRRQLLSSDARVQALARSRPGTEFNGQESCGEHTQGD